MSTDRKPRSDARLKTLPEDRQAEIASLLATKSLLEVRKELLKDGLSTSVGALSEFFSWWRVRESLRRRETRVAGLLENLKENATEAIPEDKLWEMGQSLFGAMAIAEEDGREWFRTQRLSLARRKLRLEAEKVQVWTAEKFLEWFKDQRAIQIAEGKGSNSEKIAELRRIMFADLDGPTDATP